MKKPFKKLGVLSLLGSAAILLSGCVRTDSNGHPYGMVYNYLAVPGQHLMTWLAHFVGGYGWAIIVLTAIVRIVLMPVMIKQMKQATIQQEKMGFVQPQMKKIQAQLKAAKTQEERLAANQAMMSLYRDNNISLTGGIGCLPLLIQFPIFAALYAAIRYSPELSHTTFMGISLGSKSILLAILSGLIYVAQAYLSLIGIPKAQKKQMKMMLYFSPLMIFFVTISSPAGLGIYFFIGGIFACLQTFIINLYRPKIRRKINAEMKKHPVKKVNIQPRKDVTPQPKKITKKPSAAEMTIKKMSEMNRKRNQGKQHFDHK